MRVEVQEQEDQGKLSFFAWCITNGNKHGLRF